MGAKSDPVPPKTFVARLFKPSVVWQGENGNASPDQNITPDPRNIDITPPAHLIMAVIAPWTKPFLAYLNKRNTKKIPRFNH